jgi:hypothetical protein
MPHRHPLPQTHRSQVQTLPMCRIPPGSYLDFYKDVPLKPKKFVPVGDPDSYGRDLKRSGVTNWEEIVKMHKDALPPPTDWKRYSVKPVYRPRPERPVVDIPKTEEPTKILKAVKKLF